MNDNTNFKTMLTMMWDLQTSVITVESLSEKLYGDKWSVTHHIIIPNGTDKVTDFCFVDGRSTNNNYLYYVESIDMTFEEAVVEFSKEALRCQGSVMTIHAM